MDTGITIKLDSSGDIEINDENRVSIISGISKAAQDLTVILKSAIGSLQTDPSFGTDIISLANSKGDAAVVEGIIKSALNSYKYTKYVNSVSVGSSGKTLIVNASITLSDNQIVDVRAEI